MKIKTLITSQDSSDIVGKYFTEIRNYDALTKEEEVELIVKIQNERCSRSLDKLIKANLKFVISVAKHYQGQGTPLADLISEGNSGLIEAANRFDVKKDLKFFSYAVWWIRIKIFTSLDLHKRTIQIPANRELLVQRVKKDALELEQQLNRQPSIEELEEFMIKKFKKEKRANPPSGDEIKEAIAYGGRIKSLNEKVDEDGEFEFESTLPGDESLNIDEDARNQSLLHDLNRYLYNLQQQEYDVLVLCIGLNDEGIIKPSDIALRLGIKEKEVIKLKTKALRRLKTVKNISFLKGYL